MYRKTLTLATVVLALVGAGASAANSCPVTIDVGGVAVNPALLRGTFANQQQIRDGTAVSLFDIDVNLCAVQPQCDGDTQRAGSYYIAQLNPGTTTCSNGLFNQMTTAMSTMGSTLTVGYTDATGLRVANVQVTCGGTSALSSPGGSFTTTLDQGTSTTIFAFTFQSNLLCGPPTPPTPPPTLAPVPSRTLYIGILSDPMEECVAPPASYTGPPPIACVEAFYVRWLEAAGIRVVPIPWNASADPKLVDYLLSRVNGVLVPGGGGFGAALNTYWATLNYIVNSALAMNAKGDKFFVWGTCAGFQLVAASIAGDLNLITAGFEGMEPLMMSLNFTAAQPISNMFGESTTPAAVLEALTTQPSTLNWHSAGITPAAWAASAPIAATLIALSTNTEPSGLKSFVSSYEGQTANIFATQFHPERPPFEYSNAAIGHSNADILVSRYLADFIRGRLELNTHAFDTAANGEAMTIENYYSTYEGYGTSTYFIAKFPAVPSSSSSSASSESSSFKLKRTVKTNAKQHIRSDTAKLIDLRGSDLN